MANDSDLRFRAGDRFWMITLGFIVIAGIVTLSLFSLGSTDSGAVVSVAVLLAGSCLLIGALVGFLFGIPRALQDGEIERTTTGTAENGARQETKYRVNTNLEQISDWLTKILVGVGLTQIGKLPEMLASAANYFGPALGRGDAGEALASVIVLYFPTAGFLYSYLWTRLFLAAALARADQDALAHVQAQEQLDAAALAIVQQQLGGGRGDNITAERLKNAIQKASAPVKVNIFYQAEKIRRENWKDDKASMERTIPVFEALAAVDTEKRFHKNYGQLGYALKEKREPFEWAKAEEAFTRAIKIRGEADQFGWHGYEANRAMCRIVQDEEFKGKKPSTPQNRQRILDDLKVGARDPYVFEWYEHPPVSEWLQLNKIDPETLA